MTRMKPFTDKSCRRLPTGTPALTPLEIASGLAQLPGWEYGDGAIGKNFSFANFSQTMAFVNGVARIAAQEDHHPDMHVGYKHCRVDYRTHSVGGISENDFICASKIDALCTA
jgi:4a-hydroxytetrahydrobiopterin dehydratase